jgi:hypothetical protein
MTEPSLPARKPRISLSKTQRNTAAGTELLSLCQTVTADGSLSEAEVTEIQHWLDENRSSDLPAIEFLTGVVGKILADGKVTPEERTELYKAVENVLPPELRREAIARRRIVEKENLEILHQESRRNLPFTKYDFMVAGVFFEGRAALVRQHVRAGDPAFLARDPDNQYSKNATEIRTKGGIQVGYVPESDAIDLAPLLDKGYRHRAHFKKTLTRGRVPTPVVVAEFYREDANVPDAVGPNEVPPKVTSAVAGSGCFTAIFLLVVGFAALLFIAGMWLLL